MSTTLFLWPALWAAEMTRAATAFASGLSGIAPDASEPAPDPEYASPNDVRLELASLKLRTFLAEGDGVPTVVVTPYAIHDAAIADFAPGHSLAGALASGGAAPLHLVEWRSATAAMRDFTIDDLLADLLVAVDEVGGRVNLVGLCQGGWMALLFAARFPERVARIVAAGAPVDLDAAPSSVVEAARSTPRALLDSFVEAGAGRVLGRHLLEVWSRAVPPPVDEILGLGQGGPASAEEEALREKFDRWYRTTLDLPGPYYLEVVDVLFRQNALAEGRMRALGKTVSLRAVTVPVLLLAGSDDEMTPAGQVTAAAARLGTAPSEIVTMTVPGPHLGLFMSRRATLEIWPRIARWLSGKPAVSAPARRSPGRRRAGRSP